MEKIKWIFTYINKYKFRFYGAFILVLISTFMAMVSPYLSGKLVDEVIINGKKNLLLYILAIMICATILRDLIKFAYQMTFEHVSQNVIFTIRKEIYDKLQILDASYYNKTRTGDIMSRMTADMNALRHFIAWDLYNLFESVSTFIFAITSMFMINVKLTGYILLLTPIIVFCAFKMKKKNKSTFLEIRERVSELNSVVQENISGNRVVKAFAKEDYEISKFEEKNKAYMNTNMKLAQNNKIYMPILNSLSSGFTVVMILVGGILVIKDELTLGQLVMFNGLIWAFNNPMNMVGVILNDFQRFLASSRKMIMLLNEETKIENPVDGIEKDELEGNIEFKNVCFEYEDEQILSNVSFHIKPGQKVALFGQTGSGKSTIINLIERFYDVNSGQVLIDGIDIRKYNIQSLRKAISISMQDVFLFSNTIEENISYGIPDVDDSTISWAAEVSDANNFITGLSDSYKTVVGERGVGLSGGQKQRITLARSIVKKPSILILDDTTSALDLETESEIQKNLNSIYKDKTSIIVAHRISSIKNSDLIIVIDDGRIVEQGTHDELLKNKGYYYETFLEQYGQYLNDNLEFEGVM